MTYLQELAGQVGLRSRDQKRAQEMIRDNAVLGVPEIPGFRTIHIASPWEGTRTNPRADETLGGRGHILGDDFGAPRGFEPPRAVQFPPDQEHGRGLSRQFDDSKRAGTRPGPKTVFVHFMLPHHPFVFDRNGQILRSGSFLHQLFSRRPNGAKPTPTSSNSSSSTASCCPRSAPSCDRRVCHP